SDSAVGWYGGSERRRPAADSYLVSGCSRTLTVKHLARLAPAIDLRDIGPYSVLALPVACDRYHFRQVVAGSAHQSLNHHHLNNLIMTTRRWIAAAIVTVSSLGLTVATRPSSGAMAAAATKFLESLTPAQRRQATFGLGGG